MQVNKMLLLALIILPYAVPAQDNWQAASLQLPTRWSKQVTPGNALPEYPRPQLVRRNWQNLNGLWEYAITEQASVNKFPGKYDGMILVPYPIESALSGVQRRLSAQQYLWYKKNIRLSKIKGSRTLLHFGAVDCNTTVYINGKESGKHSGGYTEFSLDITGAVKEGLNEILLRVADSTDQGVWPHGKQVTKPQNIYYTPSSGIWQTVWLETVPENYISALKLIPDIDKNMLNITVSAPAGYRVEITALDQNREAGSINGTTNTVLQLPVNNAKYWTPEQPFLYGLLVKLMKGRKIVDTITSYFGMRKVSIEKDDKGFYRIFLNNRYLYNLGTLDQGFWPDGLYTAPTDEALKFDIEAIKAMGFNTIRKHIKVEPARWYYWADRIGMLVWQDFVNPPHNLPNGSKAAFETQLNETIDQLYNHPSIITWVLFNEKWGQYDQKRLTEYVKQKDPSRLLNAHSGEILYVNEKLRSPSPDAWVSSDIADIHSYPDPMNAPAKEGRVQILGEFGGIGVFIPDHQWNAGSAWGYINEKPAGLRTKYEIMNKHLQLLEREGLAGSIYTQPFDVEGEQNGLITYDREIIKIPISELQKIHQPLHAQMGNIPGISLQDADITDPGQVYLTMLDEYTQNKTGEAVLKRLATYAAQVGDAAGRYRFSSLYIQSLKAPYSAGDLDFITGNTSKVSDQGFTILLQQLRERPDRSLHVKLMNIIFMDIIAAYVPDISARPDWNAIRKRTEPYGTPGEEIFLRAKTIQALNQQNWKDFVPAAKEYLEKYGANVSEQEKTMINDAIRKNE